MKQSPDLNYEADTLQRERENSTAKLDNPSETAKETLGKLDVAKLMREADASNQNQQQEATDSGVLVCRRANEVTAEAMKKPDAAPLFEKLWFEGEVACLFADSNVGKSILAVQIGEAIARSGKRVLYCDFELSDKQFQRRYTSDTGRRHQFSENFYRVTIDRDKLKDLNPYEAEDAILKSIEESLVAYEARIVIVDNLMALSNNSEKGDEAGQLMRKLLDLKFRRSFSMLVIGHTPKRQSWRPLTRNDLKGSSNIFNLMDSVFAIGKSNVQMGLLYIIQLKCRECEFTWAEDNVRTCTIEKSDDGFLHLQFSGFAKEWELLKKSSKEEIEALRPQIEELSSQGLSIRKIADELGITDWCVRRALGRV